MPGNTNQSHVITIDQEVENMKKQMKEPPKLLHKSAGKNSCCIFRVPPSLLEINKEAYQPRIVSIGPYHYGNKHLEMIQEHKWRFLNDMITRNTSKSLSFYMDIIVNMDDKIRECYSESIDHLAKNDLAKMMVLDGFFLIELFRKVGKLVTTNQDDPIFKMGWISPFLMRDLLRIENQIPFFVLQELFKESEPSTRTLQSLILEFFNYMVDRKPEVLEKCENLEGKHLLDFYRKSFIETRNRKSNAPKNNDKSNHPSLKLIRPATKLVNVGVKFKVNYQADSFLDIEFQNGLLLIPQINMDDFHSAFFMNCMAFEQCYSTCSKDITTYVVFMGCLMSTSTDVGLLSQNKIIENYFGTDKEIAKFFKNVGKDVAFDVKTHYLSDLFVELNEYCKNGWHVGWAGFKHTYFESPWASISAFAAFMLLSLAALQTFYTVFPYYHNKK
ncbi:hypothetical protein HanRHA438_Chr02g0092151 [Helianthus annuus]|uniref:Uncharacterized protein n=1 Tax=Helianthus annuus TaxID=4232 RepID=A0A9K3JQX9_HELAN|nr:UPF0481 protein At3g47200-like [Helianthus annuus]KAF5819734.1 hypothetical protein HanXRQr2_Chr02g0080901 [Helianthus annuus]KAJ0605865.1 hypothetical protein HanHA300_Chr02g0067731 [Helianthus annuus]KAJ0616730.1 hypothetical protein HanIR_Chr02g0093751 [Helianthus annuus]KAJ0619860.1 hypothetical protein HanHA89_Chr02g0075961 [Helianthus annuus]KAJ0778318.1 hypothetical protein HanLR1_Chr02g0070351 [Helianthus annuus]